MSFIALSEAKSAKPSGIISSGSIPFEGNQPCIFGRHALPPWEKTEAFSPPGKNAEIR
jgi:hypothetical protein